MVDGQSGTVFLRLRDELGHSQALLEKIVNDIDFVKSQLRKVVTWCQSIRHTYCCNIRNCECQESVSLESLLAGREGGSLI